MEKPAQTKNKMLLHACCGPCSLEPTRIFTEEGIDYAICYANSNIYPPEEYSMRLETLKEHVCNPQGIVLIEGKYEPKSWEREAAIYGSNRKERCRACYRLRFEETARIAKECGYDAISTTLTISPYQLIDIINEELESAAKRHGIKAIKRDFRDSYREATRISREKGMYRQKYCGCELSIAEAEESRRIAKERRAAAKAERNKNREFSENASAN